MLLKINVGKHGIVAERRAIIARSSGMLVKVHWCSGGGLMIG